jgi:hypothetical protein
LGEGVFVELWWVYLIPGILGVIYLAVLYAKAIPGLWQTTSQFNSTSGWTPASEHDQVPLPPMATGLEKGPRIITPHLETGETLEGFAYGFFHPPRPQDWGPRGGGSKYPVVIAVTPRRMLLFELKSYPQVVLRHCFIEYDAIQYLRPPKQGFLGTSGPLRFGLFSGLEYQLGFLGPIIYPEFLRQEQRLADYLRRLAARYPSSRPSGALEPQLTR